MRAVTCFSGVFDMKQKYDHFSLTDINRALCEDKTDIQKFGAAAKIKNLNVAENLKSEYYLTDFSSIIEPQYSQSFQEAMETIVGEVIDVCGFEAYDGENFIQYVIFCSSDYKLFYYVVGSNTRTFLSLNSIQLSEKPIFETFVRGERNYLIICTQNDEMWVWDGVENPYEVLDAPKIKSMAVGLDRLFIVTDERPYSVLYSDDTDPTNWTMSADDAGEINFADNMGKVVKVFSLDNYIFVIRQFGIIKIYGGKNGSDFTLSRIFNSTGEIFDGTAEISGDYIVFYSTEGLHKFDGLSTKRIFCGLDDVVDKTSDMFAICQNNKYYLVANAYGENQTRSLFILDLEHQFASSVVSADSFCCAFKLSCKDNPHVGFIIDDVSKNAKSIKILCKNGSTMPIHCNFLYKTQEITLSPKWAKKTLCSLFVKTKTQIFVKFISQKQERIFQIVGGDKVQKIGLGILCESFEIEIYGSMGAQIDVFDVKYSYVDGE